MNILQKCKYCDSFVLSGDGRCKNCGAPVKPVCNIDSIKSPSNKNIIAVPLWINKKVAEHESELYDEYIFCADIESAKLLTFMVHNHCLNVNVLQYYRQFNDAAMESIRDTRREMAMYGDNSGISHEIYKFYADREITINF